jgi:hypothetical protein
MKLGLRLNEPAPLTIFSANKTASRRQAGRWFCRTDLSSTIMDNRVHAVSLPVEFAFRPRRHLILRGVKPLFPAAAYSVSFSPPMNEWNIQSRAPACEACGQPFADQQPYRTVLSEDGKELLRSDICEPCAQNGGDLRARAGFISQWHGVFELPPPVTEVIQKDTAETLLRKLVEQNNPHYAPAAYILAVMLERKRILKVKEELQRDGRRVFVYEQPKTGDVFTIADPALRLDQLEQIQHDVAQLLEHGLNPPAAETPAPPAAPATNETPAAKTPAIG